MSLGSELVVNGGFDSDTAWTKESNWSIAGGKAVYCDESGMSSSIWQYISIVGGKTYRLQFTVSDWAMVPVPIVVAKLGDTEISITGEVVYSGDVVAGGGGYILFDVASAGLLSGFKIDNVSVREILVGSGCVCKLLLRDRVMVRRREDEDEISFR